VRFDLWDLIRPIALTGYSTEDLDGRTLRGAIRAIVSLLQRGALPSPVFTTTSLRDPGRAHKLMEQRGVTDSCSLFRRVWYQHRTQQIATIL
jgi:NADPH:quinone reductase